VGTKDVANSGRRSAALILKVGLCVRKGSNPEKVLGRETGSMGGKEGHGQEEKGADPEGAGL